MGVCRLRVVRRSSARYEPEAMTTSEDPHDEENCARARRLFCCRRRHRLSAQNREHQQMAAELRMLQEQTQQLAITLAAAEPGARRIGEGS